MTMMGEWIGQAAAAVSLASGVPRLLRASITRVVGWRERRAATSELSSISDRELADIELGRGEIDRMFKHGVRAGTEDTPRRVTNAQRERMLGDLGLSGMLYRPAPSA